MLEQPFFFFVKDCSLWRTHVRAAGRCEEEEVAEGNCCGLTIASQAPVLLGVEESGVKE